MLLAALLAGAAAFASGGRSPDAVQLKDGRTLAGHVLYEDEHRLILLQGTRELELEANEVERVDSVTRTLDIVLTRLGELGEQDVTGLLDLARYCKAHRLPGEAEVLAWAVLTIDAQNEEAHLLLGHKQSGRSWRVRASGRSYRFEDLAALRTDWGDAWGLATTHYELRSNVPLGDAVRAALDLERIYHDLYAFLGPQLRLRDVIRPLKAWVHANVSSFPESADGQRSYFSPSDEALIVNAAGGYEARVLVHEAVHQFLWATGAGRSEGRAEVPGWLDEGLAEYFVGGIHGSLGRLSVAPGGVLLHHFKAHAAASDPYKLSRVLAFDVSDYGASSGVALKYAQSYTLVHFCLHGEGGKHREPFFDFLRACWEGKSSMTAFKSAIGTSERDFEQAWTAYVRGH